MAVVKSAVVPVPDYSHRPGINRSDIREDHIAGQVDGVRFRSAGEGHGRAATPAAITLAAASRSLLDTQEV
jgi:hypothetical protein